MPRIYKFLSSFGVLTNALFSFNCHRTTTESTGSAAYKIAHALNLPEAMVEFIVRTVRLSPSLESESPWFYTST